MKVSYLKNLLSHIDDDVDVVVAVGDHAFTAAVGFMSTALKNGRFFSEDDGADITSEAGHVERVHVLVIE